MIFSVPLCLIFLPASEYSRYERRLLAEFPEINKEKIFDGSFTEEFEKYTQDHFPARDILRSLKANISYKILGKKDNNGIYTADGHISKLDGELDTEMLDHALGRMKFLYDTFMKENNTRVYLSVVPDKNIFLAKQNGYPSLDYEKLIGYIRKNTEYAEHIDILPLLSEEDYYKTDSHWKQENITDIAELIGKAMGTDVRAEYEINELENPFYGVYYGQSALFSFPHDRIKYLTNSATDNATVTYYDTGMPKKGDLYNMEKAFGKDPYEMFLSGSTPLAVIENLFSRTDKELVIIRDSFGSSLAPLLIEGYKKITLADIRYMQPEILGNFVGFEGADVLFIYSTSLLNNSLALK